MLERRYLSLDRQECAAMNCQNCKAEVGVFSSEWQSQRDLPTKRCPSCSREVEVVFGARSFITWLFVSGAIVGGIIRLFGTPWPYAISTGFTTGLTFALFSSLELRVQHQDPGNIRSKLNKPIALPDWLNAPSWLRSIGRAAWATGSLIFLVVVIAVSIPSPWSDLLLLAIGAIGVWRREVWLSWFKLDGYGALAYSAALIFAGVGFLVHHYA
jgi:hypothetical protein